MQQKVTGVIYLQLKYGRSKFKSHYDRKNPLCFRLLWRRLWSKNRQSLENISRVCTSRLLKHQKNTFFARDYVRIPNIKLFEVGVEDALSRAAAGGNLLLCNLVVWQQIFSVSFAKEEHFLSGCCKMLLKLLWFLESVDENGAPWICKQNRLFWRCLHTATYFETRQDFWRLVSIELACRTEVRCFMIVTKYKYKYAWKVQL